MHPAAYSIALLLAATPVVAQELPPAQPAPSPTYANCQPPSRTEYLLLLPSRTPESQERIRRSLPKEATQAVCSYLNDPVTRVGGFTTIDNANAWAKYLKDTLGVTAAVVKPGDVTPSASPNPNPSSNPAPVSTNTFNPQSLGGGYAVLVDFNSQPEVATQVQQATNGTVGLVAYRQRPYLLAIYTADQAAASVIQKNLNDRGLRAFVADSRQVTLLRSAVVLSQ